MFLTGDLMLLLCFFLIFYFSHLRNWTANQDQTWGEGRPLSGRNCAKFQRDLLRDFGGRDILCMQNTVYIQLHTEQHIMDL